MGNRNYWGYRINAKQIEFFRRELEQGRLRQGWGWLEGQNLKNLTVNEGAKKNLPILLKVKKGDILLIPHLPAWGEVAVVEATEDFDSGYQFEIAKENGDFGHIFPAKFLKSFIRSNENVTGNLQSTLKVRHRFWNINHYSEDIENLLNKDAEDLKTRITPEDRLENAVGEVFNKIFDEDNFSNEIYKKLNTEFSREQWEFALVHALRKMFPFYQIDRVGGKKEKNHGTDILIRLPSMTDSYEYAIAIQVKDYQGFVNGDVIEQIKKSETYWNSENLKLIDKVVIITQSAKEENSQLIDKGMEEGISFIFANEFKELLLEIGKSFVGIR